MKRALLALVLTLAGCTTAHPPADGGTPPTDAPIAVDAGSDAGPYRNAVCAAGLARHQELGCTTRGVLACPVVWDGAEQCDLEREATCLDRLANDTPDCIALSIVWRGDCINACSPTTP